MHCRDFTRVARDFMCCRLYLSVARLLGQMQKVCSWNALGLLASLHHFNNIWITRSVVLPWCSRFISSRTEWLRSCCFWTQQTASHDQKALLKPTLDCRATCTSENHIYSLSDHKVHYSDRTAFKAAFYPLKESACPYCCWDCLLLFSASKSSRLRGFQTLPSIWARIMFLVLSRIILTKSKPYTCNRKPFNSNSN